MKQCIALTHEFVNDEILCKSSVLYPIFGPVYMFLKYHARECLPAFVDGSDR